MENPTNKGERLVIEYFYAIVVDEKMRARIMEAGPQVKEAYTALVAHINTLRSVLLAAQRRIDQFAEYYPSPEVTALIEQTLVDR
jgi:hypothetical protein